MRVTWSREEKAFGYPVTLEFIHAETSSPATKLVTSVVASGEKRLVPLGVVPKALAGISSSHFTVFPVSNFAGELVLVSLSSRVLSAKRRGALKLISSPKNWMPINFGPGKRYPGLYLMQVPRPP